MSAIKRINNEINKMDNPYENNSMAKFVLDIRNPFPLVNLKLSPKSLKENYYNIVKFNNYELIINLKIDKNVFGIEILISNLYPFEPPKVKINNKTYHFLLQSNNLKKINYEKCLCCSSIICPDNWVPSYGIIHIINEIYQNIYKKKCIVEILHLEKLEKKYLKFNSNIKNYLFF
tara:strand:- start:102 stop:626 length:525 start_codon:yes stop_codon:yes gene_type:complete